MKRNIEATKSMGSTISSPIKQMIFLKAIMIIVLQLKYNMEISCDRYECYNKGLGNDHRTIYMDMPD